MYTNSQYIGKPNNFKVFGRKKHKGPRHANQGRLSSVLINYILGRVISKNN
jgi:hypothetical protein